MLRRWLIRLPFLFALIFTVAVWVTSYFGGISLDVCWTGGACQIGSVEGLGVIIEGPSAAVFNHYRMHFVSHSTAETANIEPSVRGFYVGVAHDWPASGEMILPLWLPTILLALLLWFVWRKTRPKAANGAFPVETLSADSK